MAELGRRRRRRDNTRGDREKCECCLVKDKTKSKEVRDRDRWAVRERARHVEKAREREWEGEELKTTQKERGWVVTDVLTDERSIGRIFRHFCWLGMCFASKLESIK